MLKAGLIGHGGIGGCHIANYYRFNRENDLLNLTCVCDFRKERLELVNQDEKSIRLYEDIETMLEQEELDLVTIALPTYLHHDVAIQCLKHGVNVLCEKPMSITTAQCNEMISAAKAANRQLMIGQCLRFSGDYLYIKKLVEEKTYGNPISVSFIRSASGGDFRGFNNWYLQKELSGGGSYDLHIHDADIMRYIFGDPYAVTAISRKVYENSANDSFAAIYSYDQLVASCESDWSWKQYPFCAEFTINFENATVKLRDGKMTIGTKETPVQEVTGLPSENMYYAETKYFAECVRSGAPNLINPPEESMKTIRLLNAEEESAKQGGFTIRL